MFKMPKSMCVAALAACVLPAFAAEWMTDLEAAKSKAAAEGKAVLVDFTGSDWCGWCIRLRKDVLDKPEFAEYAADKFVLMEVDVPQNPGFDRALLRRNQELCKQYGVDGFPTVMVLTPEGELVGGFVGGRENLDAARPDLDAALANVRALKAAEALEDAGEKLAALHAVYLQLPEDMRASAPLRARLVELDVNNTTGLRDEIKAETEVEELILKLRSAGRDGKAMLAIMNEALQNACPQNRSRMLEMKLGIQFMVAETVEDVLAAKQTLLEMAEADPDNAEAIRAVVNQRFADPAKVLDDIKKSRKKVGN